MARRASSKIQPLWIALILGVLALAVAIGMLLQSQGGDPYRTVAELDMGDYLNNANSLRGNVYKVKGKILQSLGYSRAKGRLFSIEVSANSDAEVLPVLIPPELSYVNLQKGERFTFRLEVDDAGILKVLDLKKG